MGNLIKRGGPVIFIFLLVTAIAIAVDIGGSDSGYFNGTLDEVRIYSSILSQSEASENYRMNLWRFDPDSWMLFVNRTNTSLGTYTYEAYATDSADNTNKTEERYVTVAEATPELTINFVYPLVSIRIEQDLFFNITLNVSCRANDCNYVNISLLYNDSVIVSETDGNVPFFTNDTNPRTINLVQNENEVVVFWINATGTTGKNYSFFAYANLTSDMSNNNITQRINVSISEIPSTWDINLINPADNAEDADGSIAFAFNASSNYNLTNCSIYTNESGGFSEIYKFNAGSLYNFTNTTQGAYTDNLTIIWNVRCSNIHGASNFSLSNRTITMNFLSTPIVINATNLDKDTINITWSVVPGADSYKVYITDDLTNDEFDTVNLTTNNTFVDNSTNTTLFYKVVAYNETRGESTYEKIIGRWKYTLGKSDSSFKKNWISLPLNNTKFTKAQELMEDIPNATSISLWNATTQSAKTCNEISCPSIICTTTACNFKLNFGDNYEVTIDEDEQRDFIDWTLTGGVFKPKQITMRRSESSFSNNWISLPANTTLQTARDVLLDIGDADGITKWNYSTQTTEGYVHLFGPVYVGTNFQIEPNMGYEVSVTQDEVTWTQK